MSVRKTCITVASAACLAIAVPAVEKYEGYAPTVVPDKLANGLPTGGFGETEGVELGETHDRKYWSDRLAKRLAEDYDAGIGQCIHVELPDGVRAYALSTSYNAGVAAVCSSPMVAKWNAGDIEGGCKAIYTVDRDGRPTGWRVASHPHGPNGPAVVQPGLVNRRKDERSKCLAYARGELKAPVVPMPESRPSEVVVASAQPAPVPSPTPIPSPAPAPDVRKSLWHGCVCMILKCKAAT
jgi:lysozyme